MTDGNKGQIGVDREGQSFEIIVCVVGMCLESEDSVTKGMCYSRSHNQAMSSFKNILENGASFEVLSHRDSKRGCSLIKS